MPKVTNMDSMKHFKKIKNVRIIDVYGSEDRKPVLEAINVRRPLGKKMHQDRYQQLKIEGANHFYNGKQNELVNGLNIRLTKIMKH